MKNERNITINVIHNDTINNRKLAEYFAKKFEMRIKKIRKEKS